MNDARSVQSSAQASQVTATAGQRGWPHQTQRGSEAAASVTSFRYFDLYPCRCSTKGRAHGRQETAWARVYAAGSPGSLPELAVRLSGSSIDADGPPRAQYFKCSNSRLCLAVPAPSGPLERNAALWDRGFEQTARQRSLLLSSSSWAVGCERRPLTAGRHTHSRCGAPDLRAAGPTICQRGC